MAQSTSGKSIENMQRYTTEIGQHTSESEEHETTDDSDEELVPELDRKRKANDDDFIERREKLEKKRMKLELQQSKVHDENIKRIEDQQKKERKEKKIKKDKKTGSYNLEEIWKRLDNLEKLMTQLNERYNNTANNDLDTFDGEKPLPNDTKSVYECLKRSWIPNIMKKLHDLEELVKKQ